MIKIIRRFDKYISKLENKILYLECQYDRYKDDYNDVYKYWENKDIDIANNIKKIINKELSNIDELKTKLDKLYKIRKENEHK